MEPKPFTKIFLLKYRVACRCLLMGKQNTSSVFRVLGTLAAENEYLIHVKNDPSAAAWFTEHLENSWRLACVTASHSRKHEGSTQWYYFPVFLLEKLVCHLATGEMCKYS